MGLLQRRRPTPAPRRPPIWRHGGSASRRGLSAPRRLLRPRVPYSRLPRPIFVRRRQRSTEP
eukprot:10008828-Lingulodinium_polyedra.AAC.1